MELARVSQTRLDEIRDERDRLAGELITAKETETRLAATFNEARTQWLATEKTPHSESHPSPGIERNPRSGTRYGDESQEFRIK